MAYEDSELNVKLSRKNKTLKGNIMIPGPQGRPGEDGFSPTVTVKQNENGAEITITDRNGTTTVTITNGKSGAQGPQGEKGEPGKDGAPGVDGYTPVKGVDYWTEEDKSEIEDYVNTAVSESGGVSSWKDLTDKPFYEEDGKLHILPEQDIAFAENLDYGNYASLVSGVTLTLGETYFVVWDSVECQFTAVNYESLGGVGIGNPGILGLGADSGETFCIGCIGNNLYLFSSENTSSHRVSIYQKVTFVKPLDEKFLPMDAINDRVNELISEALEALPNAEEASF